MRIVGVPDLSLDSDPSNRGDDLKTAPYFSLPVNLRKELVFHMGENIFVEGFKAMGDRALSFYASNKGHIFTGLGVGGTIATGLISARSGARGARKIDQREYELQRKLTFLEKAKLCWPEAIGPLAVGGLTCLSDIKADRAFSKIITERTTLLIASEKAYEKLSQKTKEVLGEKKAQQIKDEIAKDEVKDIISQDKFETAPRCGNGKLYPFVDGYSKILFWSNIDHVNLCVMKLQKMMSEISPRGGVNDYYDKKIGVPYFEWLSFIGVPEKEWNTHERRNVGWNKGFAKDGSDDDPIEIYRTTDELEPGFAVTILNWIKEPTDMTYGRLIKSSGV